jgi:hypothetical protein
MTCRFCAIDHGDADCPPPPAGSGWCSLCMYVRPLAELSVIKVDPPYTWFLRLSLGNRADVAAILSVPYTGTPDLIDDVCINRRRPYSRRPRTVSVNAKPDASRARAAVVPADHGITKPELMTLWGLSDRPTRDLAGRLVAEGSLLTEESPGSHGGSPVKRYRRAAR